MARGRRRWDASTPIPPTLRLLLHEEGIPNEAVFAPDSALAEMFGISRQHARRLRVAPHSLWTMWCFEGHRLAVPETLVAGWTRYQARIRRTDPSSAAGR
jgi:hypothetical protein